jgi:predicted naringenin-chalcone synthase
VSHPKAHIAGVGLAVPPAFSTEHFIALDRRIRMAHGQPPEIADLAAKLARGTGIVRRHTVHPGFTDQQWLDIPDIFTDADYDPPLHERLNTFKEYAPKLAIEAARKALADWGGDPRTITHVITTATTGWFEPGLGCALIEALELPLTTRKQELNFNGCFCGATCLRLGRDIIRGGESGAVLVVALELSFGHYEPVNTEVTTLVANSLFADGAAAMVLAPEGRWAFERSGMSLVPNSKDYLTFQPPSVAGRQTYEMFLHRAVGSRLAHYFREEAGRHELSSIIDMAGGKPPELAVHPGGPNILEAVGGALTERGWPSDCLASSFHTLHNYGNLGSAAMLFVLANSLPNLQGEHLATFAFGPGVTVEWGYYRRVEA